MSLRRREHPRPSIKKMGEKDPGQVEWVTGLFFLLIMVIVMYTQLQLASWRSTAVYLEDALAASNLASALIDVEEYGKTHKVKVSGEQQAFAVFEEAVKTNLGLDEQWECQNKGLITGPVEIVNYMIYNVDEGEVVSVRLGSSGEVLERRTGTLGSVRAPDGSLVEQTGIYSELRFKVKGFPGMEVEAHKGKLVDIVSEKGEEDEKGNTNE